MSYDEWLRINTTHATGFDVYGEGWPDAYFQYIKVPGGYFKNAYELFNLRALKCSMFYKNCIFQCIGKIFWVVSFEIPHKISNPCTERCVVYSEVKI